jgi:hypothetical protein
MACDRRADGSRRYNIKLAAAVVQSERVLPDAKLNTDDTPVEHFGSALTALE